MTEEKNPAITDMLIAWSDGDGEAMEQLTPIVYRELHRLAHAYMAGERPGHSLQTTALVHEAYLRLIDVKRVRWASRTHFFAMAGRVMRRILVDFARKRNYLKRGGGAEHVDFDEALAVGPQPPSDLVAIDVALEALAGQDPRKVQVVELRFFAGLSVEETAQALGVSPETVRRDWRLAKAWLQREIRGSN